MKPKLLLMSLLLTTMFISCGVTSYYSLRQNYTPQTSIETASSYDEVWNNVVDFFAQNNLSISVLEKDSGLIAASNVEIMGPVLVTQENRNGQLVNPSAWFVIPYNKAFANGRVKCSINVRVKKTQYGMTHISVNLGNIIGYRCIKYLTMMFTEATEWQQMPVQCVSTGNFEADLLNLFK